MKFWDLRKFNEPVQVYDDLWCKQNVKSGIGVSEKYIAVGTAVSKDHPKSMLNFFDLVSFEKKEKIEISEESISTVQWHKELN